MLLNLIDTFRMLLDSQEIIQVGGLALILAIVFAETGLFFGFFLPGDYLLFAAGVFCGTELLDYPVLGLASSIAGAAILGNYVGYFFGRTVGQKLFQRKDSLLFKKQHLEASEKAFTKYGNTALIIGRFLPIIRTFAPILAGVHGMSLGQFSFLNIAGGLLWVFSLTLSGYYLGHTFPQIIDYLHWIIIGFIAVTTIVLISGYVRNRRGKE